MGKMKGFRYLDFVSLEPPVYFKTDPELMYLLMGEKAVKMSLINSQFPSMSIISAYPKNGCLVRKSAKSGVFSPSPMIARSLILSSSPIAAETLLSG